MSPRLVAVAIALTSAAGFVAAQSPVQRPANPAPPMTPAVHWRHAVDEWDAGQYPEALRDLISIMKSPSATEYRDRVALLTGEVFVTTELTTDGRNPRFSPDGQYASYEAGAPAVTRVARVDAGGVKVVAELPGVSAAFNSTSTQVLYLRPAKTPEWTRAADALEAAASAQERAAAQAEFNTLVGRGDLVVRELTSGAEHVVQTGALLKSAPLFAADGRGVLFVGVVEQDLGRSDVYLADGTNPPVRLTDQPGHKTNVLVDPSGAAIVYTATATPPFRAPGQAGAAGGRGGGTGAAGGGAPGPNPCGGGRGGGAPTFGIVDVRAKTTRVMSGSAVTMSADGQTIAWLGRTGDSCTLQSSPTLTATTQVIRTAARLDAPALSPDGKLVAYQMMPHDDWELYVSDGTTERRVTHEIQHDVLPHFLNGTLLLGMIGEPRHRRSYLYDLSTADRTRLFANNTIRTIAPEYIWLPSADGARLLIQAERDGDTVSPARGVYVVDLTRRVTPADVLARLNRDLADETDLRQRMTRAFQPIADMVRRTLAPISTSRIYEYEKALGDFDTKYIGRPGNQKAIDYLMQTYASFGYTPEEQWFSPRQAGGGRGTAAAEGAGAQPPIRTANVVATLPGTENPELIYVVGSHFDSVQAGPGADDDTSGTSALLETARVLHGTPLPATVVFASFTGEEAGDLGSREFVRLAAERRWKVVGALNNDMIGWSGESARMDNTIRYSNAGIRDLQHGAAFLFSNLITYDARYYKSTDAQAFFDGWGDIVGGIGSYPVLGNPNYHQATDTIETVNFQQVAETAKVTAATIMYLASSPSRLKGLTASRNAAGVHVTWTPSPERGIGTYIVAYGPATDSLRTRVTVTTASASLPPLPAGTEIAVKAVNGRGLEGWDWARTVVQ